MFTSETNNSIRFIIFILFLVQYNLANSCSGTAVGDKYFVVDLDALEYEYRKERMGTLPVYADRKEFFNENIGEYKWEYDSENIIAIRAPDIAEDFSVVPIGFSFTKIDNAAHEVSLYAEYKIRDGNTIKYRYDKLYTANIHRPISTLYTRVSLYNVHHNYRVKIFVVLKTRKRDKYLISSGREIFLYECSYPRIAVENQKDANRLNRIECENMPEEYKGEGNACREYEKFNKSGR